MEGGRASIQRVKQLAHRILGGLIDLMMQLGLLWPVCWVLYCFAEPAQMLANENTQRGFVKLPGNKRVWGLRCSQKKHSAPPLGIKLVGERCKGSDFRDTAFRD